MMRRIYLDHAATTPMRSEVVEAMLPYFTRDAYNPNSLHAEGRAARVALDAARATVAEHIGAKPREIVFTGGGSEADTLAVLGAARARRDEGTHVITAATEHRAVLRAFDVLRGEGFEVCVLPVDAQGRLEPETFARAITSRTTFASIMLANNETGVLHPIRELAAIAREKGVLFHTDAVQAPISLAVDARDLGVDLLSLSAHKIHGPKGIGMLYVRGGTPLAPLIVGGGQEFGLRAGTENVPGIVGLATALTLASAERSVVSERMTRLRDRLEAGVKAAIPTVRINGTAAVRVPHIVSFSFPEIDGSALLIRLDLEGIAVSGGSACAAGALEPSHVMAALGEPSPGTAGIIRCSLGRMTTEDEIDRVLNQLPDIVKSLT